MQERESYQRQLDKIRQWTALFKQDLAGSTEDDQVQSIKIHGQGSSYDVPAADSEILDTGLTSGIIAEARKASMGFIDKYATDYENLNIQYLNKLF